MIFNSLYGIRLQLSTLKPGEAWCQDIYKIDVVHESEGLIGHIYCDFYDRPRKPHQDCHFTIVGGKELADGTYQVCIYYKRCFLNFHIKPNFVCRLTESCCCIDAYVAVSLMGNSKLANTQYGRQSIPRNGTCYAFHVGQVRKHKNVHFTCP